VELFLAQYLADREDIPAEARCSAPAQALLPGPQWEQATETWPLTISAGVTLKHIPTA
jgi:hypothetical protein